MSQIIQARSTGGGSSYQSIPVYSLTTAGGPFLDNPEARLRGRIHPPKRLKSLDGRYLVVTIEGHSMEPKIPSGSHCLLRYFVAGSRTGRTVLVEERKIGGCAYTLKQYMRHPPPKDRPNDRGRVFLKSFNQDQEDIELTEDDVSQDQCYEVIAEFVEVLAAPLDWVSSPHEPNDE